MPVIRIRRDTWERLKRWAVPLEDTADDAVRRALDAAGPAPGLEGGDTMLVLRLSKGAAEWLLAMLEDEYPGDEEDRAEYTEVYGFVDSVKEALELALKGS